MAKKKPNGVENLVVRVTKIETVLKHQPTKKDLDATASALAKYPLRCRKTAAGV
jgi:hypothetical protein